MSANITKPVGSFRGVQSLLLLAGCLVAPSVEGQKLDQREIELLAQAQVMRAIGSFREYLAIPNDAHFPADIRRVLDWLTGAFSERGFTTTELQTGGSPLLLAKRTFPGARRTVLFYLQSDGQPVSPADWHQADPYAAVLKEPGETAQRTQIPWDRLDAEWNDEWRIFARSASDSKGPNIQFLAALDAMDQAGFAPDFNIKVIVDTEEELGSPHLQEALVSYREALAADWLVILDGPPHVSNRPTLKFGARGIATFTLTTYGPRVPQHSGHYGNYVPNPALRLAQILASMKDEAGRVTIPGFYDGVSLDSATMAILNRVPDDERAVREKLGIATTDSVAGSLQEAVQYPSLNVRGMSSGWVGDQRRTIVPATATAEVDVRLVLESDPERLLRLVREHIEELGYYVIDRAPTEEERLAHPAMATFTSEVSYGAFRTDFDSEPGRWLTAAMVNLYGEEPIKIRTSGGSIPISPFVATLGVPAVSVPTVNPDNNQHSPNENIRLGNFREGIKVCLAILAQRIESIP
jgi:acetylornithine deacetylase/succinyl-diaminopimelate desuccinylase-like protein